MLVGDWPLSTVISLSAIRLPGQSELRSKQYRKIGPLTEKSCALIVATRSRFLINFFTIVFHSLLVACSFLEAMTETQRKRKTERERE